jgi:replicative DNA helicase
MNENLSPFNRDAEVALLGSILLDDSCIHGLDVESPAFFIPEHQIIWEAMLSLKECGSALNQITVAHELAKRGKLEEIGGAAYLTHLVVETPTSLHAPYYAGIVKECWTRRKLISLGQQMGAMAESGKSSTETIAAMMNKLLLLEGDKAHEGLIPLKDIAKSHGVEMEIWLNAPDGTIKGLPTGFKDLDRVIDGLEKGTLYIIAARPSMGKTMLCLNIAKNLAKGRTRVGIFSLEQNRNKILERMVFAEARLNRFKVRHSDDFEDKKEFWDAWSEIAELPIRICDTTSLKSDKAISETMALQLTAGLDAVIFDYIGLAGDKDESEVRRIGQIVKNLKSLARLCDIPVLAVSQLSRASEYRQERRPSLSDLRDSGELEQTGDVVIGLYRPEYYDSKTDKENTLECIILKNRDGPRGTIELYYNASTGFMADMVKV